jgi:hypothetical protein
MYFRMEDARFEYVFLGAQTVRKHFDWDKAESCTSNGSKHQHEYERSGCFTYFVFNAGQSGSSKHSEWGAGEPKCIWCSGCWYGCSEQRIHNGGVQHSPRADGNAERRCAERCDAERCDAERRNAECIDA